MSSTDLKPSPELLARLANEPRDEEAWRQLYREVRPLVWAMAYRFLRGSRDLAEDVCQDVFIRLVRYAPFERLQTSRAFRAYLWTVTRNLCYEYLDRLRQLHRETPFSDLPRTNWRDAFSETDMSESTEGQPSEAAELRETVEKILAQLDGPDRSILELLLEGHSLQEIATLVGLSYQNTAVRLSRLRVRLRNYLLAHRLRENAKSAVSL